MGEIKKKKKKILFLGFVYIYKIIYVGRIFVSQNFSVDQAFFD